MTEFVDMIPQVSGDTVRRIEAESLADEAEQQAALGELELAAHLVREALDILRTVE